LTPLERGQIWVMRVHAIIAGAILLFAASIVDAAQIEPVGLPGGLVTGLTILLLIYPVAIMPARRYRAWRYRIGPEELHIEQGVLTRIETIVPLARVQHIDVSQGPIERAFAVSRLVLHTAGTMHSRVVLPGLSRATAEAIRDEVRSRIRQDAL
jgi:uncharacterized protein